MKHAAKIRKKRMIGHYTWAHGIFFLIGVAVCLIVDLRAHKRDEAVSVRDALLWSAFWIALSLCFAAYIGLKMLLDVAGIIHMTPMFSLAVVCLLLMGGVLASWVWPEQEEKQ